MTRSDSPDERVEGHCDARFEPVREAFRGNFAQLGELGAAVSIRIRGRLVVDLHGGFADPESRRPWERDTLVNAYSVGKGVLAILSLILLERRAVELDEKVASLWPEFAANGKEAVTLRMMLSHRAGLPAVRERLPEGAMLDWARMCGALAAQRPYWEPGSDHGYHVNTYGYLVGEVLRRATGRPVGALLHEVVCGPLGAEFYFGLPRALHHRVARMCGPTARPLKPEQWALAFPPTGDAEHDQMIERSYFNPSGLSGTGVVNTPAWRESVIPSTSGHASAHAVAAIYAALLGDASTAALRVAPQLLTEATTIHSDGHDRVLRRPSRFGLGFQLSHPSRPLGAGDRGFGHYGYGGSLGFADPEAGIAFGYLSNLPGERWLTPRTQRLVDALYACL